jgi:hypothetical protein
MRNKITFGVGLVAVAVAIALPPLVTLSVLPLRVRKGNSQTIAVLGNSPKFEYCHAPATAYDFESLAKRLDGSSFQEQQPLDPADKAARSHFAEEAKNWDFIGVFKLKDQGAEREIALYYFDLEWVFPNILSIHAVYQVQAGDWVHKEIYSSARVGFVKVQKRDPAAVVLELMPACRVNSAEDLRRAQEINKPFLKSISFENGDLVAK